METFTALQEFLYTDRCRHLDTVDSLELIELANRLCLPRLLAMTEEHIVQKLQQVELCGREIYEEVLWLIEPAQVGETFSHSRNCRTNCLSSVHEQVQQTELGLNHRQDFPCKFFFFFFFWTERPLSATVSQHGVDQLILVHCVTHFSICLFQLHNASQLAAWCLWYVSSHYTTIYRKHSKIVHSLRPDNQVYLSKHRWPPLW